MKFHPLSLKAVQIAGFFWGSRRAVNRTVTLPLEYDINKERGVLKTYQWDWWDPAQGVAPWKIVVGDLGKWIEAASYSLATDPDPVLDARMEEVIAEILKGQKEDGYLFANPIRTDQQWANLQEYHELYDGGHTIEAAVAHYETTGRRHFLDAMCRYADLLVKTFGRGPGQIRGYCGHPEIELALMKLYRATGTTAYLELADFFVDERGRQPFYFDFEREKNLSAGLPFFKWYQPGNYVPCQAHQPLKEQKDAVGHSVRALYLYSGAVDVAAARGDRELLAACRRLWNSVTRRRMYITGGVGSTSIGEAFTFDYDLPDESGYAETCANIALVFFAHRLLQIEPSSDVADVMERALYNGILSGVALDGRKFFYANHLAVCPSSTQGSNDATALDRQKWFGCACCPPNVARLLASLGHYIYSQSADTLYVHLFVNGTAECILGGHRVHVEQETRYPWEERVNLTVTPDHPGRFTVALRLPGWCRKPRLKINGKLLATVGLSRNGYVLIRSEWQAGDRITLDLPMPVERVEAHPGVRMECGRIALQRGPVVYCLEEVDNGKNLADLMVSRKSPIRAVFRSNLLGGCVVLKGLAQRRDLKGWETALYRADLTPLNKVRFTAVPYALWANRKPGEMRVWIREN